MPGAQPEIMVLLDSDAATLSGAVRANGAPERRFSGWLGLLSALQEAVEAVAVARPQKASKEETRS